MSSSLSSVVDNLSEGLHNYKCTVCKSCFDYISTEDNQLIFQCFNVQNVGKTMKNILIKIKLYILYIYIHMHIYIIHIVYL